MKIIYIALKYDYGKPQRGYSFEHFNFYDSLVKMENGKHEVIYFPFDELSSSLGLDGMNKKLLSMVKEHKPDLCFFFLFEDEIYPETIKSISDSGIPTFNWFADDHWRWPIFSQYYAPNFTWVSTTDSKAIAKYNKIGYRNIIHTQWACNNFLYKPASYDFTTQYDVTFVGQPHSDRRRLVKNISDFGIKIDCFGGGWPNGRVDQEKMINIFGKSKINLNPTKSSGGFNVESLAKIFVTKKQGKIKLNSLLNLPNYIKSFLGKSRDQIKGRTFETPGCGGFLISGYADNIEDYYISGKEMVFYKNEEDLIAKIKYYLMNEDERKMIAKNGFERTVREHTYELRFKEIFKIMGL